MTSKRALITGISSGIGAATARLFREQGVEILGLDRNDPTVEVDSFYKVDLGDPQQIDEVVRKLPDGFNYVCNIAGVPPTADKQTVLRVNFFGLRDFTTAIAPNLSENASIVSVASLAGMGWRTNAEVLRSGLTTDFGDAGQWIESHSQGGAQSYHLSKELLIAWTVANWDRWRARGIRINTVSPGPVSTPILTDFIQTLGKRAEDDLKVNRAGSVEEIASVIVFLCSPQAHWINGADIPVDGGAGANALRAIFQLDPT